MGLAIGLAVAVSLSVHVLSCLRRGDPTEKGLLGSGALRWVQRITGAVVLLFVGFHVHQIWSPKLGADVVALGTYEVLQSALGSPLPLVVYVVGISCLYFHLAHGVCRASVTWRLVSTARGMRTVRYAAGCFGALLWGLTLQVVATFSIGQGLFG